MEISGRAPLLSRVFVLMMIIFHETIYAKSKHHCHPSSCGNLYNISYAFRLSNPQNCSISRYELSCQNNFNVLYLKTEVNYTDSDEFPRVNKYHFKSYVQAVKDDNYTVRFADFQEENCNSIPVNYFSNNEFTPYYSFDLQKWFKSLFHNQELAVFQLLQTIVFLTCEKPVKNSLYYYIARPPCIDNVSALSQSKRQYSYAVVGSRSLSFSDLEESCSIDQVSLISTRGGSEILKKTPPHGDIHSELVYGFEASWPPPRHEIREEVISYSKCYIMKDSNEVRCRSDGLWTTINFNIRFYCQKLRVYFYIEIILGPRLICTVFVIALLIYKWNTRHLSLDDDIEEFLQSHINTLPTRYSYWEIKQMSHRFKVKLGEGGFGSVYKGKLSCGRLVAIKMLGKSKASGQDFINEVATIGRIHHVNVVRLLGFCVEGSKRALIYDFMPNGSLDKYIFSKGGTNNFLSYKEIHKISIGVARGIEYLHQGCDLQILHFDIKPHNILLDADFMPKVSDFGLARLCPLDNSIVSLTAARGTIGYIAPEMFYKNIGGVSYRADVYSFGMLLMEMANKRKNLNANAENSSQIYFPLWIYDQFIKGKDMEIKDATEEESETVKKMIMVALWCIQLNPCDRPSMKKVIEMLEGEVGSLKMPPKPYLFPQEQEQQKHNGDAAGETSCSPTSSDEDSK